MSTPPNKRDERREARRANLANAQSTRRVSQDDTSLEASSAEKTPEVTLDVTEMAPDDVEVAASTETPKPVTGTPKSTTARPVGASKTPTRPTTSASRSTTGAVSRPTTSKTPTRPTGTGGATVGRSATPSRPIAVGASTKAPRVADSVEPEVEATSTKRDQRREARRAELVRVQEERRRALQKQKQQDLFKRWGIIAAIAASIIILTVVFINLTAPTPVKTVGYGANMFCDAQTHDSGGVHYHANLQIYVNGKNEPVPANIGISTTGGCLWWTHTHQTDGVIHIEAPTDHERPYTLGDFMYVWNQDSGNSIELGPPVLSTTDFFGAPVDADHPLTIYVNGTVYTGDPNAIVLESGKNIWLVYGKIPVTPTPYDFKTNSVSP